MVVEAGRRDGVGVGGVEEKRVLVKVGENGADEGL